MQGEVGESSLIIKLRIIENKEIRGNGGRVIFIILVPPGFRICRSHGARGNQKSGEGGGKKQAEFRPGLTQTGAKPACFLNVPANMGIFCTSTCSLSLPKVFVP